MMMMVVVMMGGKLVEGKEQISKYEIRVEEEVLTDLQQRLQRTRLPDQLEDADDWSYGANLGVMKEILAYWRDEYDWRSFESYLNTLPHFMTEIDGFQVHFVHFKATKQQPPQTEAEGSHQEETTQPLMFIHGWPGSFLECLPFAERLIKEGYDVVCPSIPGYGFSSAPKRRGFDQLECARIFIKLMARLGYQRYGLQGGDWGSVVASLMAQEDATHVVGLHLNMVFTSMPLNPSSKGLWASLKTAFYLLFKSWLLSADENAALDALPATALVETGYLHLQATKPQTLAYALTDSPLGLAAYIIEKYQRWSDCQGDVLARFSKQQLVSFVMLYWLNGAIAPSIRFYYEFFNSPNQLAFGRVDQLSVSVPTGFAIFPKELFVAPRVFAEFFYDIRHWSIFSEGGHFAALEQPDTLARDAHSFFLSLKAPLPNQEQK